MSNERRRVVITGVGIVAPNGIGKEEFFANLITGKSFIKKIERFDTSEHPSKIGGEITNFNPSNFMDKVLIKRTDLSTQYALAATRLALKDARLEIKKEEAERSGVVIGIAVGGVDFAEKQFTTLYKTNSYYNTSTYTAVSIFPSAPIGYISIEFGTKGYNNAVSTGCTSGTVSIITAYNAIKDGLSDIIIAGGTESPIAPLTMYSFCKIRAVSTRNDAPEKASRPFDKMRDGFVISEGSGMVVMEELEHALKRDANIYAEVIGYGITCNSYHMTAPEPDATQSSRAIKLALKYAGIKPEDIDYINAHGSSTPLNGKSETLAFKKSLGEYAYKVPISSIKSMVGHPLGAAGGWQTVTNCLVLKNNILPPTINYEYPDEECDLDYIPNKAREKNVNIVLQNSAGFAGVNAALILKKYK